MTLVWTYFGRNQQTWTSFGHHLDTFWKWFGHIADMNMFWTHFGHFPIFCVQNVSVPTSFRSPQNPWGHVVRMVTCVYVPTTQYTLSVRPDHRGFDTILGQLARITIWGVGRSSKMETFLRLQNKGNKTSVNKVPWQSVHTLNKYPCFWHKKLAC